MGGGMPGGGMGGMPGMGGMGGMPGMGGMGGMPGMGGMGGMGGGMGGMGDREFFVVLGSTFWTCAEILHICQSPAWWVVWAVPVELVVVSHLVKYLT
jgi:hypothetical protein